MTLLSPPDPSSPPAPPPDSLADDLARLAALAKAGPVTFGQLVDALGPRAATSLLVILAFAFLVVPVPGVSTAASVVFLALALAAVTGSPLRLPAFARRRTLPAAYTARMFSVAARGWARASRHLRPRATLLTRGPLRWLAGVSLFLAIVAFALPIPIPFNNSPPALCILLLALGLLARDGVVVLLGHLATLLLWAALLLAGDFVWALLRKAFAAFT